ncbi:MULTISPECIES: UbiH/UbiF family hydroxylase [Alphaproteobacteria]|uniref:2-octaprenyl-6-methoxyphenol hydroxylase n=2 Tax=Alphaproteobacteria TaxID=28211 RepID=A0A512HCW3_9HYPH|nr:MULTISPECIES: UbiH/UbiF family hydroxylase [Alphaproteobacteria]GEO83307.1 2-octaprenyl-6-methoxyphenol hydroxylase [Ciceribacter naphthalenivorans]GLR20299.1 2-octaprenyl-6-methoxyphenol hydroxylase [Ciceribacter naphthalenivorans]GLT03155.1 2-octaprenyl-6-methoxyphenol hydroxylase [Sphingomonas psychrolutea]
MRDFEIAVVGGGLAGSIAAIALARGGRRVAFVAPASGVRDGRTTALMDQSIRMMERLGLWEAVRPAAAALSTMQIIDGTKRLLRAPVVAFRSAEIDLDAFGYNMPNSALLDVLGKAVAAEPNISVFDETADEITIGPDKVAIRLSGGDIIEAGFVVGADGRKSPVRESAGVGVRTWSYPQTAVVLNFAHTVPHRNVSTEFHGESGPFTQVPLPGERSSLVWVVDPKQAEQLLSLTREELSAAVESRMQSMLGEVSVEDGAQAWPLSGMSANRYGKGRAAFIGEAGHAFPPIGAQGLNLSLRDIAALEEILCDRSGQPIDAGAGDRFDRKRRVDVISRTASVDLLNRSLLSSQLPVQMLRAAGLQILSSVAPLRNMVMQEGVAPGRTLSSFPSLLREKIRR